MCKRLYCRNGILKNEQVPELYGNHLERETGVVFHTKKADTIDPGDIVVRVIFITWIQMCGMIQDITMTTEDNVSTSRN